MQIKGISREIIDLLVARTTELSQGRNNGCIGFINESGIIDKTTEIVDGGLSGMPLRILLGKITPMEGKSLLEGIEHLPNNAVVVATRPGKTGLITDVGGVDFFNLPIISIGVKDGSSAGVGIIYPKAEYFNMATESEKIDIEILSAMSMENEKDMLRESSKLSLEYLDVAEELPVVESKHEILKNYRGVKKELGLNKTTVNSIDKSLAEALVKQSTNIGQGREVAMMAVIDDNGHVVSNGKTVAGGIGYVPSRLLASSAVDITDTSLRYVYSEKVPINAIIVHTHPGGTGVMHLGDANAGPGSWGRPIIAIGHDNEGQVRGATVIEVSDKLYQLADEDERLNLKFFEAETPEEEADIRNRKFGVAQEYTNLCKPIEMI